jgi:nucleoside-diphosphate-sugar epimerase
MVSDGEDLSTPDLIRCIGSAMGREVRLLPCPVALLRVAGSLIGKRAEVIRLCGSLAVDLTKTREELGWFPPVRVEAGIARTVNWYLRAEQSGER